MSDAQGPWIVIITGPPGTGKSTVAKALLARLAALGVQVPLLSKDGIKETLFATLGWRDEAWSRQLSQASMALLYRWLTAQVAAEQPCVVEANFYSELATPELQALLTRYPFRPLQILCRTDPKVLVGRLQRRAAVRERHPGHLDAVWTQRLRPETVAWRPEPLDIGGVRIEIDTTRFEDVQYGAITERVAAAASLWHAGAVPDECEKDVGDEESNDQED